MVLYYSALLTQTLNQSKSSHLKSSHHLIFKARGSSDHLWRHIFFTVAQLRFYLQVFLVCQENTLRQKRATAALLAKTPLWAQSLTAWSVGRLPACAECIPVPWDWWEFVIAKAGLVSYITVSSIHKIQWRADILPTPPLLFFFNFPKEVTDF